MSAEREAAHGAVTIRRARVADATAFARIMGDPAVYPGLMQIPYAHESGFEARIAASLDPAKSSGDVLLAAERDGQVVGTCGLHPAHPSPRRRHAMFLGISVSPEAQGQGVGGTMMQAMCDVAERWMGVTRLELTVYVDNARAIALYRRFGFETEGRMRRYALRDGCWVDALLMARITDGPRPLDDTPPTVPS